MGEKPRTKLTSCGRNQWAVTKGTANNFGQREYFHGLTQLVSINGLGVYCEQFYVWQRCGTTRRNGLIYEASPGSAAVDHSVSSRQGLCARAVAHPAGQITMTSAFASLTLLQRFSPASLARKGVVSGGSPICMQCYVFEV